MSTARTRPRDAAVLMRSGLFGAWWRSGCRRRRCVGRDRAEIEYLAAVVGEVELLLTGCHQHVMGEEEVCAENHLGVRESDVADAQSRIAYLLVPDLEAGERREPLIAARAADADESAGRGRARGAWRDTDALCCLECHEGARSAGVEQHPHPHTIDVGIAEYMRRLTRLRIDVYDGEGLG